MKPVRIQLSRKKGWKMPENTVKVDRSTKWGNPFHVGRGMTRAEAVDLFAKMAAGYICLSDGPDPDVQLAYIKFAKKNIARLRGKNLACWCKIGDACHADLLLKAANK